MTDSTMGEGEGKPDILHPRAKLPKPMDTGDKDTGPGNRPRTMTEDWTPMAEDSRHKISIGREDGKTTRPPNNKPHNKHIEIGGREDHHSGGDGRGRGQHGTNAVRGEQLFDKTMGPLKQRHGSAGRGQ